MRRGRGGGGGACYPETMDPRKPAYLVVPAFVLLVSLGISGAVSWQLERTIQARDEARFFREAAHTQDIIVGRVETAIALLDAAAGLFAASGQVSPDQLRAFVERLDLRRQHPAIQGIGWSRRISAVERAQLAKRRRGGAPSFDIWPDHAGDEFHPIIDLEPVDRHNQAVIGYDMFADPVRRAAMERARDTGRVAVSAKLLLPRAAPEDQARPGFLIFVPLYQGGGIPETPAERSALLSGFVFSPVHADALFAGVAAGEAPSLNLELSDGSPAAPEALLYRSQRPAAEGGEQARFSLRTRAEVGGRQWTFAFANASGFDRLSHYRLPLAALVGGVFISLILAAAVWAQGRARLASEQHTASLRQSQRQLREQREWFRTTLASIGDAVITTDTRGQVRYLNPMAQTLTAWTAEEAEGAALNSVFTIVNSDSRQVLTLPLAKTAEGEQATTLATKTLLIARDGGERPIDGNAAPIRDEQGQVNGFVLIFRDITERRRAEKALRQSGERFRFLAEVMPQKIFTARPDGEVDYFNRQWLEFSGLAFDEIKGWGWKRLVHPDDIDENLRQWQRCLETGEPFLVEHRIRGADGTYRWHLSRAQAMRDPQGKILMWIGSNTDVDDLKAAEQWRSTLLDRERVLRAQAEAANRAKDEFLATLSHELRTPLNAILGWTQTLLKGSTRKDTLLRALTQIELSAKAQAQLVGDLLNVSDIVAGRLRLEVKTMQLIPVIEAAVAAAQPAVEAKHLALLCELDPAADAISGDAARLQQVVWNLLSNAVKFSAVGGTIRLELSSADGQVTIAVSDNGEGISAEFLPYVFNRFFQADPSSKRRHGGLGLGLAIVRHLVELHGGTVAADSPGPGSGARFTVRLPVLARPSDVPPAPPVAAAPAVAREAAARRRRLTGLRILSVDDDRNTREMLQEALERGGAEVVSAASAAEALTALRQFRPDVLVSDIGLPEQDGYNLLQQVRALPPEQGGAIPAVAVTGYARAQDRAAVLLAGYQAFTAKPVDLDELFAIIFRLAKRERPMAADVAAIAPRRP